MAKALRRAGATVRNVSETGRFTSRAPRLLRTLHPSDADVMLVGFPGHADVPVARLGSARQRTPVLFDAFVSLSESAEDRGHVRPGGLAAKRYWLEDRVACRFATRTILDTDTHASYFADSVGVPVESAAARLGRRRRRRDQARVESRRFRVPGVRVRELHTAARAGARGARRAPPRAARRRHPHRDRRRGRHGSERSGSSRASSTSEVCSSSVAAPTKSSRA